MSSFPEQGHYPEQATYPEGSVLDQGSFSGQAAIREPGTHSAQVYGSVDLAEASRQLELAAHDIAVAASCIGLGDLDEAHTNVITARAAADAAEEILRVVLGSDLGSSL